MASNSFEKENVSLIISNTLCLIFIIALVFIISTEFVIFLLRIKKKMLKSRKEKSILSFRVLTFTYIVCLIFLISSYIFSAWTLPKDSFMVLCIAHIFTANVLLFSQLISNKNALEYISRKLLPSQFYYCFRQRTPLSREDMAQARPEIVKNEAIPQPEGGICQNIERQQQPLQVKNIFSSHMNDITIIDLE